MSLSEDVTKDMSKEGWAKALTYKFISVKEDGKIIVDEIDFHVTDMDCACRSKDFLWLAPQRAGVFLVCRYCNTVTGPLSREAGVHRKSYEVTYDEAISIRLRQGAQMRDRDIQELIRRFRGPARRIAERPRPEKIV